MVLAGETAAGVPVISEATSRGRVKRRIAVLDGYRALAILSVLSYHYTVRWAPPEDAGGHLPAGRIFDGFKPLEYGWLGVEFFFVISGFVILMTLESCTGVADFVIRRFARLWPPMLVAATLTTIVIFLLGPDEWLVTKYDYLTSILFLDPGIASAFLHHPGIQWADGAYWSLWTEICFYFWAAGVYLLVRKNFVVMWLGMFLTIPIGLFFYHVALPWYLLNHHMVGLPQGQILPSFFINYIPYFTLGICAYEIWSGGAWRKLAIAGAAITAALILYMAAAQVDLFAGSDVAATVTANLLIFALFALFVLDRPLVGIFRVRPLVLLGQASYSLYLIHQEVGIAIMRRLISLGLPYLLALPLTIMVMIGVSLLLFRAVEIPAKSWLLRRAKPFVSWLERQAPKLSYKSRSDEVQTISAMP